MFKTQKDETREFLEGGEEKEKKLALRYAFLLPFQLGSSSCLSSFSNLRWFCTRKSTACWSCPFLGFSMETTELQSVLQQAIELPVETNSFPALSSPARQSVFCSLSFQSLAVLPEGKELA